MKHVGALVHHPEIAEEVGHLIGHFATLEYHMFICFAVIATFHFANLTHDHIDDCFGAFYERRSVNNKGELALSIAEPRMDQWRFRAWQRLWRRFKGASSRRTEVAHCVFMGNTSSLMRLRATAGTPTFEPLDLKFFERTNHQYRTLGRDISTFLTFLVGTEERLENLLRVLPLPINIPFPEKGAAPPDPPDPHEKDEQRASVYRLGLAAVYED